MYDTKILGRLYHFLRPHRILVLLSILLLFLVSAAQLVQPYILKRGIDLYIVEKQIDGLMNLSGFFVLALVAEFVFRFLQLYVLERTGQNLMLDLRMHVFAHLQKLPAKYFDRHPVGRLMTRVTSDIEALNEAFTSGLVMMLADTIRIIGIVTILLWMDWKLALITFAIIPPLTALTWYFRLRSRRAYQDIRKYVAKLNAFLQETVVGMRIVQLFSREQDSMKEFKALNDAHRTAQLQGLKYESIFSSVAEMMGSIAIATILWFGGMRILAGVVTFGTLVAFVEYSSKFFRPLQELAEKFTIMQSAIASAERVFDVLDTEVEIESPESPTHVSLPLRGDIEFQSVTFGYVQDKPVIEDVSFHIEPGEHVGVVGWTGAGKSTLIKLLVRLYDAQAGKVLVDGVDIKEYDPMALRRAVGVVLQDHFLLADTIEKNISLGSPDVTKKQVREAAKIVGADRFIKNLPRGYDTVVLERGSNLSVGQKQLISFARALAFNPGILIMDEATASVDPATEEALQKGLEELMKGRTAVIIAHRLSTVKDLDRILVMHKGVLREQGEHDALVQNEGGIYRTLYELQTA